MELHSCFQYGRGSNGFITEKTILFQGSRGGSNIFEGGRLLSGGGGGESKIPISIEPHITCDFLGGGGGSRPPITPMDLHINTEAVILIETGV